MIKAAERVAIVGTHADPDVSAYDFVIRLNAHQPQSHCNMRVIGSDCDVSECLNTIVAGNMLHVCDGNNAYPWTLNHGSGDRIHLWFDEHSVINSFDFIPLTGIVAINLALVIGAKDITCIGFDFYGDAEQVQTHYLPPQREYFRQLVNEGIVKHVP